MIVDDDLRRGDRLATNGLVRTERIGGGTIGLNDQIDRRREDRLHACLVAATAHSRERQ